MDRSPALPFTVRRKKDVINFFGITSTHETMRGLLRVEGDKVVLQWRTERKIDRVGWTLGTEREFDAVREVTLPVSVIADATVHSHWWWPFRKYLVLTGVDLRAFETLLIDEALPIAHPAELVVRIDRGASANAREFATELRLVLADRAIQAAETMQIQGGQSQQ